MMDDYLQRIGDIYADAHTYSQAPMRTRIPTHTPKNSEHTSCPCAAKRSPSLYATRADNARCSTSYRERAVRAN